MGFYFIDLREEKRYGFRFLVGMIFLDRCGCEFIMFNMCKRVKLYLKLFICVCIMMLLILNGYKNGKKCL